MGGGGLGGAKSSLLGTTKLANGNDITAFGGEWYALHPNGQEPEDWGQTDGMTSGARVAPLSASSTVRYVVSMSSTPS